MVWPASYLFAALGAIEGIPKAAFSVCVPLRMLLVEVGVVAASVTSTFALMVFPARAEFTVKVKVFDVEDTPV